MDEEYAMSVYTIDGDVSVLEQDGITDVRIKPFNLSISYTDDHKNLTIKFEGPENNSIVLDGNTTLAVNGNFVLASNGFMQIMSKDNMHLDTVGSKLFLNSRNSPLLIDTEEAREFKKMLEIAAEKRRLELEDHSKEEHINGHTCEMMKRILIAFEVLEERLVELEKSACSG